MVILLRRRTEDVVETQTSMEDLDPTTEEEEEGEADPTTTSTAATTTTAIEEEARMTGTIDLRTMETTTTTAATSTVALPQQDSEEEAPGDSEAEAGEAVPADPIFPESIRSSPTLSWHRCLLHFPFVNTRWTFKTRMDALSIVGIARSFSLTMPFGTDSSRTCRTRRSKTFSESSFSAAPFSFRLVPFLD